jgi:LysM repeat protein
MFCEAKVNSIKYLVNKGAIDDVRRIVDTELFDRLNEQITKYAQTKYNLDTNGSMLFSINMSESIDRARSRYWRDAKYTIYRAVPNDVLFEELDQKIRQVDAAPASINKIEAVAEPKIPEGPEVSYILKITSALSKINRNKFEDSKLQGWVNDLKKQGVSDRQIEIFKEEAKPGMTKEEIAATIVATYSYTVEINTAKERKAGIDRWSGNEDDLIPLDEETPTQYYSNLTVPGGTNYTEQEIATPAITPSIKGHAQFATDQGIGWFRSDDKVIGGISTEVPEHLRDFGISGQNEGGVPTKTRRILEVQSDLFQKGRDKTNLINYEKEDYKSYTKDGYNYFTINGEFFKQKEVSDSNKFLPGKEEKITKQEFEENITKEKTQNQFLQLLNKDNNWVTFFIKSVIQDSAKKGYEKVLFPSGDTASKVEGHTTLEEFKKQKQDRIKKLEEEKKDAILPFEELEDWQKNIITEEGGNFFKNNKSPEVYDIEINQLKQELERVEKEGFGALKPIYNFYENTVSNILKKQKYNPKQITDEYGNTWNEVIVSKNRDLSPVMFMRETADISEVFPLVDIDLDVIKNARSKEIGEIVAKELSYNMGIDFKSITEQEAKDLLKNQKIPYRGEPAFYFARGVYFVGDNVNINTVLHEFSHPLLQGIRAKNPKLFVNLYNRLSGTGEGQGVISYVKKNYPELSEDSDLFKEEVLAYALQLKSINKLLGNQETEEFKSVIDKILAAIKKIFRDLFGSKVNLAKLDVDTNLEDLASMMLSEKFDLIENNITEEDLVMYGRFVSQRANELSKLENAPLVQDMINQVFDTNMKLLNKVSEFRSDKQMYNIMAESLYQKGTSKFLPGIQSSLRGHIDFDNTQSLTTEEMFDAVIDAEQRRLKELSIQATALVNSLDSVNTVAKNIKKDLDKISNMPNINARNVVALLALYKNTSYAWLDTMSELDDLLSSESEMQTDNKFYQLLNEITTNYTQVNKKIADIYKSNNVQFFVEITGYMNKFVIDELNANLGIALKKVYSGDELENAVLGISSKVQQGTFSEDDAKVLAQQGVPADILNDFIKKYQKSLISESNIKDALTGHARDVTWFNRWMESYSSSNDIIVGPLAIFIQDQRTEVENEVWKKSAQFRKKLEELLPKVNFNKLSTTQLRDMLVEKDTIFFFDEEGKPIAKEIYSFLQDFGNGWRYELDMLDFEYGEAKKTGDKEKTKEALQKLRQFKYDYMWDEYTKEIYEKDEIFKTSELGGMAYAARKEALDEFNNLLNQFDDELSRFDNYAPIQAAWRNYQQLYSLYYEDGTPKIDDPASGIYDLSISKLLIEHREATSGYYESIPVPGSLQTSYNEFVSYLLTTGLRKNSPEFKAKMKEWEKQNLKHVNSPAYYEYRNELISRLQAIQAKMNAVADQEFNVGDAYKTISDLIYSYKDEHGQPMSDLLTESRLSMVRDLHQKILDFKFKFDLKSGLTKDQSEELDELSDLSKKQALNEQQEERYVYLINLQKNQGITPQEAQDIRAIFSELASLSSRVPTDYYMDALNYNLSKQNIAEVTDEDFSDFINSEEFQDILDADPQFRKWFDNNHVTKNKYVKDEGYVPFIEPSMANTYTVPNNEDFIEKTEIIDTETGQPVILKGVPNSRHSRYEVKDEYRTIPKGENWRDYIGIYKDNTGNWLPRKYEPGNPNSAESDRFMMTRYQDMKRANSAEYQLLEAIKEFHLQNQEGGSNYGKLYLDMPRYAIKQMDIYQAFQVARPGRRMQDLKKIGGEWMRQMFGRSRVNYSNDLNYNPENNLVNTDLKGNEISYVPVEGIFNLDIDITDADVLQNVFRYALSFQSQKKLLETLPLAESILDTLEDPKNQPKNLEKFRKDAFNIRNKLQNTNKKGVQNNRLEQVRSLIEREYEGRRVVGMEESSPMLSSFLQILQGLSTRGSLALNIPSDLKNKYSGYIQLIIEGSGAEFVTLKDIAMASPWAVKAMMNWTSKDIYSVGPGTLSGQIIQIFDPTFRAVDQFGTQVTRSIVKDLANGEWMYMHRKFGEMEVALKLFGSFMYGQKIDMLAADGTKVPIRYMDAWELDSEGIAKLKDGIHPGWNNLSVYHTYTRGETFEEIAKKYNVTVEELQAKNKVRSELQLEDGQEIIIAKSEYFKQFKNRMQGVSRRLFGVYDKFGQPEGNKLLLWRMFFFMRKWFTSMFVNRFGMDTSRDNFGAARYDWALGKTTKGYYVSSFQTLYSAIKTKGQKFGYMTDQEKADFRRFGVEGMNIILMSILASVLLGWDDDDEDKYKKLKRRSGAINESTFKTYGFLANHALLLMLGVQAETSAFVPLPKLYGVNLGADDYAKMITSNSAAFYNTVILYVGLLGQFLNFATGNDAARFKRDVGPYPWQKKGELKIWKSLLGAIGITGGTGDPTSVIKNLRNSSSRIGGG